MNSYVSVIIPTYNSAEFVVHAIDSVLNQTYTNYEVIVIDDGSIDNTRQILEPYQFKINYIYQEHQGVAAARNKGIDAAKGELIAFLDADDLFLPQKLQQQIAIFKAQPNTGMVISGWHLTDQQGKITADVELWHTLPQLDLKTWLYWKPVLLSATMIRRHWLVKVGGFPQETIPVEDVECFLELILQGCEAVWCQEIGTVYRQVNSKSLSRNTLRRVKSLELVHQHFFGKADLPLAIKKVENHVNYCNLVWSAWHLYQNGYAQEFCDYLRKSLNYSTQSAGEISLNWIESFEDFAQKENLQLDTYQLTQTPGWQELIIATLATKIPQVSVIIPAYNSAKYLPEAIASVLEQTYTDYEIIVINDGSTDNTHEVVTPYLDKIRYFEQSNQGVSATRNRGIYLAKGELIAFLDADDIFLPQKLAQQVEILLTQPEIGIVNSGFCIITEAGKKVVDIERWHKIPNLTPEIWLLHKPVLPSAMMFRRDWLMKVEGFDPRFFASEDVDLVLRMVIQGCQSTWLKTVTVYYRQHNSSASWRNPTKQMANAELMQDCFFARTDIPPSIRNLERQSRYDFLVWIACVLYQAGCISEMITYFQKSLAYTPYSWSETIAQWLTSFHNSAELNSRPFDTYALSKLPEWQQLVVSLQISPIFDHYSQKATEYQTLTTYQPTTQETAIYSAAYAQLGKKLMQENDLEQAVIWLRKAIALKPNNCWYQERLATALLQKYDLESAIATYRQAIRLKPNYEPFKTKLDSALTLQRRWRELTSYCEQLITNPVTDNALRILMIFPYPPYPSQKGGAAIRMFEQIKYFGSRHHLTVVSFIFDETDYEIESQLAQYCDRAFMVKLGTPLEPYQANKQRQLYNFKTWNMWRVLQQLSQVNFDLVSFEFIVSTIYHNLFSKCFMVLNEHNIESKLLSRCAAADQNNLIPTLAAELDAVKAFLDSEIESKFLSQYENQTWQQFSLRTVVSDADKQELDSRCSKGKTLVVKNGVDVQNIQPIANPKSHKVLFMGTMSYYPNIDGVLYFIAEILPLIWQQNPLITFCIAGREPPKIIQDLAINNSQIEVFADPENMSKIAAECKLSVVPLRSGSGTRIKILHSMAMGLPVISTSVGCEGLTMTDQKHLLIQDIPIKFAQAVVELIKNQQLWQQLRTNGRQLVETQYDWSVIYANYEQELLRQVVKSSQYPTN
jgi:glycosyltransferase involved in cell wall biosynthesis